NQRNRKLFQIPGEILLQFLLENIQMSLRPGTIAHENSFFNVRNWFWSIRLSVNSRRHTPRWFAAAIRGPRGLSNHETTIQSRSSLRPGGLPNVRVNASLNPLCDS